MKVVSVNRNPKRERKKTGLLFIAIAVMALCAVVGFGKASLLREKEAKEKQYRELQERLLTERERSEYLTERRAYMQTTRYIEEMAREKLGLVRPDEVIFRPKEEE